MATQKPRKPTPNQQEYLKEISRIEQFIKRAETRGYVFGDYSPPEMPSKVTKKSIQRLRQITPSVLYQKAKYYSPITDTWISGTERRQQERQLAARKAEETKRIKRAQQVAKQEGQTFGSQVDNTYDQIWEIINTWAPSANWSEWFAKKKERDKNVLANLLRSTEAEIGKTELAKRLSANSIEAINLANRICYDSKQESIEFATNRFAEIIKGGAFTSEESAEFSSPENE